MGWRPYHKYPRTLGTHLTSNVQRKRPGKRRKKLDIKHPEETDTDPGWVKPSRAADVLMPEIRTPLGARKLAMMALAGVYEFGLHWVWGGPDWEPDATPTANRRMRLFCLMQIERDKALLDIRRRAYAELGHNKYVEQCGEQKR